ncbi:V-type proton ATPase subunit E 1-like isoform X2 [Rhodnius prolixus]
MFKKKIIQRAMDTPLSDEECQIRISELIVRIENAAEEMVNEIDKEAEFEADKFLEETQRKMELYDVYLERKQSKYATDYNLFRSRLQNSKRVEQLVERDKLLLNVVLAVHNRLGNVDHKAHRKAYRRILYSLVLQGLCKLVETEVKVRFRKSDLRIGMSVLKQAAEQFEKMSGISVNILADTEKYLPLESCGGVDIFNIRETVYVRNALSVRLDRVLFLSNPLIRYLLFGLSKHRKYYDLSFSADENNIYLLSYKSARERRPRKETKIQRTLAQSIIEQERLEDE